jgi:hypothetical protein
VPTHDGRGRLEEKEAALRAKVAELLKAAEDADAEEDTRYGKGKRGDELPEELRRAKSRLEVIRKARRELEAEAKRAGGGGEEAQRTRRHRERPSCRNTRSPPRRTASPPRKRSGTSPSRRAGSRRPAVTTCRATTLRQRWTVRPR